MKINDYSKLIQLLVAAIGNLQKLVEGSSKKLRSNQIIQSIEEIKTLAEEANTIKSLTLIDQDFTRFCVLLINGSDMAAYLLGANDVPKKIQNQANSWKSTAASFKPFLKNSIYNKANSGNSTKVSD